MDTLNGNGGSNNKSTWTEVEAAELNRYERIISNKGRLDGVIDENDYTFFVYMATHLLERLIDNMSDKDDPGAYAFGHLALFGFEQKREFLLVSQSEQKGRIRKIINDLRSGSGEWTPVIAMEMKGVSERAGSIITKQRAY